MIRVLCVEDDVMARDFILARLEGEPDIRVAAAVADAAAALQWLQQNRVDVVLLDQHLVGMDGLRLLESFSHFFPAEGNGSARPAVLFCTGWADPDFVRQARALGAAGVLSKAEVGSELVPALHAVANGLTWLPVTLDETISNDMANGYRVLVADHDRRERARLEEILHPIGCATTFAWNGREALAWLEREPFHLFLLSHRLPGPVLASEILERLERRWPDTQVLLLAPVGADAEAIGAFTTRHTTVNRPIQMLPFRQQVLQSLAAREAGVARRR